MSSHICTEVEQNLWRYIDRELPARELGRISGHLKECEACKQQYLEGAREANSYRMAFCESPFGDNFSRKFHKRMEREGLLDEAPARTSQRPRHGTGETIGRASRSSRGETRQRATLPRGWPRALRIAAMVVCIPLVLAIGYYFTRPTLGSFSSEGGSVMVRREGARRDVLLANGGVLSGDRLEVDAGVTLKVRLAGASRGLESNLYLEGPAVFVVQTTARRDSFVGRLDSGRVSADVVKDPGRRWFRLDSPDASAEVLGTQFTLEVDSVEGQTLLTVDEGSVEFRPLTASAAEAVVVTPTSGAAAVRAGDVFFVEEVADPSAPLPESSVGSSVGSSTEAGGGEAVPTQEPTAESPPGSPAPRTQHPQHPDLDWPVPAIPSGDE